MLELLFGIVVWQVFATINNVTQLSYFCRNASTLSELCVCFLDTAAESQNSNADFLLCFLSNLHRLDHWFHHFATTGSVAPTGPQPGPQPGYFKRLDFRQAHVWPGPQRAPEGARGPTSGHTAVLLDPLQQSTMPCLQHKG